MPATLVGACMTCSSSHEQVDWYFLLGGHILSKLGLLAFNDGCATRKAFKIIIQYSRKGIGDELSIAYCCWTLHSFNGISRNFFVASVPTNFLSNLWADADPNSGYCSDDSYE